MLHVRCWLVTKNDVTHPEMSHQRFLNQTYNRRKAIKNFIDSMNTVIIIINPVGETAHDDGLWFFQYDNMHVIRLSADCHDLGDLGNWNTSLHGDFTRSKFICAQKVLYELLKVIMAPESMISEHTMREKFLTKLCRIISDPSI